MPRRKYVKKILIKKPWFYQECQAAHSSSYKQYEEYLSALIADSRNFSAPLDDDMFIAALKIITFQSSNKKDLSKYDAINCKKINKYLESKLFRIDDNSLSRFNHYVKIFDLLNDSFASDRKDNATQNIKDVVQEGLNCNFVSRKCRQRGLGYFAIHTSISALSIYAAFNYGGFYTPAAVGFIIPLAKNISEEVLDSCRNVFAKPSKKLPDQRYSRLETAPYRKEKTPWIDRGGDIFMNSESGKEKKEETKEDDLSNDYKITKEELIELQRHIIVDGNNRLSLENCDHIEKKVRKFIARLNEIDKAVIYEDEYDEFLESNMKFCEGFVEKDSKKFFTPEACNFLNENLKSLKKSQAWKYDEDSRRCEEDKSKSFVDKIHTFLDKKGVFERVGEVTLKGSSIYGFYVNKGVVPLDVDLEIIDDLPSGDDESLKEYVTELFGTKEDRLQDFKVWRGRNDPKNEELQPARNIQFKLPARMARLNIPIEFTVMNKKNLAKPNASWVCGFDALRVTLNKKGHKLHFCKNFREQHLDAEYEDRLPPKHVTKNILKIFNYNYPKNNIYFASAKAAKYIENGLVSMEEQNKFVAEMYKRAEPSMSVKSSEISELAPENLRERLA